MVRETIQDFKGNPQLSEKGHHISCGCCQVAKPKSDFKELKFLAVIVFAVTLTLVGLNAYQRDRIDNDLADAPILQTGQLGPGATQAAELSFPTKTPTQPVAQYNQFGAPMTHHQQQYAMVPLQMTRPSEPVLQLMAVPSHDSKGNAITRLKRVVSR